MIKFSEEEGFIKAHGFKHREGQDKNIKLPSVAVGVFSRHLFDDVIEKYSALEVGYFSCANMERNIYIIKYKDIEIVFFMAGVSGPLIAGDIEELYSAGVQKVIIFGNCGVLDSKIEDCSIIIPTRGFRDEGTSYHYVSPSETIEINPDYKEDFIKILNEYNFDYTEGYTWTTDAFYRETKDKIKYFKDNGAVCVEMEGTVIASFNENKYEDIDDMINKIKSSLNIKDKNYIYVYNPEPDTTMHITGTDSKETRDYFELINKKVEELYNTISDDTLLIVVADHGHINCDTIILEDYKDIFDTLAGDTSFEGRLCSFKIKDGREEEFVYLFNKYFSNYFVLMTKEELIDSKLLGNGTENKYFRDSLGDYFALAYSNKYFKYRNVGHIHKSTHAGLTEDEMKIPLIILNKCKVKRK